MAAWSGSGSLGTLALPASLLIFTSSCNFLSTIVTLSSISITFSWALLIFSSNKSLISSSLWVTSPLMCFSTIISMTWSSVSSTASIASFILSSKSCFWPSPVSRTSIVWLSSCPSSFVCISIAFATSTAFCGSLSFKSVILFFAALISSFKYFTVCSMFCFFRG